MDKWDVIVVGARCAGAATAAFLARAGVRTLCLERSKLSSDHVLSTHYVQPPGMDVLDELGVGTRVRELSPPSRRPMAVMEMEHIYSNYADGRAAHCIRRFVLDPLIQEAAAQSGATLREQAKVVELVKEGERVAGVVVETPSGRETLRADLVIGADGKDSTVAKLTGVERYEVFTLDRAGYWAYFPAPDIWWDREHYDCDGIIAFEGDNLRYVFQCDDNLLLLAAVPPAAEARSWGKDHRERLQHALEACELTAPLARGAQPVGDVIGLLKYESFFRRPIGPGFALVGDAGLTLDFVTGQGIAQGLLNAKALAEAVVAGRDEAYERYWRQRDADVMPLFLDAKRIGSVGFNNAFTQLLFRGASKVGDLDSFCAIMDRRHSPFELAPQSSLFRWVLGDVLRLRFGAVKPFLEMGKTLGEHQKLCDEYSARAAESAEGWDQLPAWPMDAMGSLRPRPA
ncbi:MAG: FAD-dependent monooxygenase [Myxococcales bacterium]|nr:FAD-dependent monooxygenase [Myxococcales bacterium]